MNSQYIAAGSRPMQALAQPHGTCSKTLPRSRRNTSVSTGYLAPHQLHGSQCISQQQLQAAAVSILSAESRAAATYTDSWMPPARRTPRATDSVQPRKQQQPTCQQQSSSNTSSSNVTPPTPPVAQIQAAYQPPTYATSANDAPRRSTSGQTSSQSTQETLASAVDKMYKQRLREVKAMLTPESLQQLQQELSPEELQSLQVVIRDLGDLQGSWAEEDEHLNVAEQQLVHQVTSAAQIMPDDFNSYLLGMLPPGSDADDLQQLLLMLDEDLLQDLQSVYHELKEFEQADLELSVAQDRYIELSGRIAAVAARIKDAMEQQQQQQQQPPPQQQQQRIWQAAHSSSRRSVDAQQQEQQEHLRTVEPTAAAVPSAQRGSSSSTGASSSSRKWGSTWVKPQRGADRSTATTQQQRQQQHELQGGKVPVLEAPIQQQQQQQEVEHLLAAATAAAGQRQQQQPGVRQRRRRIIRRDAPD